MREHGRAIRKKGLIRPTLQRLMDPVLLRVGRIRPYVVRPAYPALFLCVQVRKDTLYESFRQ